MLEDFIIFDFSENFLIFTLIAVFFLYCIVHIVNYNIENTVKYLKSKYIIKEFTSLINTIFYTLIITMFLLYVTSVATFVAKNAKEHNIRNGADGFRFIVKLGLNNK